jgi:hypothetical protein
MGIGISQPLPLKYGVQGELGRVLYVAVMPGSPLAPPSIIALSASALDAFNAHTGDRRQHLVAPPAGAFTCGAHSREALSRSSGGRGEAPPPLLAVGTAAGEVHILHAQTLAPLGSLCTTGQPPLPPSARPRLSSELGAPPSPPKGDDSVQAPPPQRTAVTAVAFFSHRLLLVGHGDGSVGLVEFDAATGGGAGETPAPLLGAPQLLALKHTPLLAPPPGCAAPAAVAALAAVDGGGAEAGGAPYPLLAVGHRGGSLYLHDVPVAAGGGGGGGSAPLLFPTPPGLARLLPMPRLRCLAAFAPGSPSGVSLLDMEKGRLVALDFEAELRSVGRARCGGCTLGAIAWDDARAALLGGGADGAVYVRVARRIDGTGDLAVRLLRVAPPAPSAKAPAPITAIRFLKDDTILTGDESGLVRRVPNATGLKMAK